MVGPDELTPSLYILNAAALSKPGAIDHLTVDLKSYGISVAIVTETHFKTKHKDSIVSVDGYTVFRRDRVGRRGGGVAVYVTSALQSSRWTPSVAGLATLEVDWVRVGDRMLIAALYHPPRPIYKPEELLDYVDACVSEISHDFPLADIVIAGDVNQLSDRDVVERTGLTQIVRQPTRGTNILDRIYVSSPDLYRTVRVVKSVVRSDHKAVVAFADKAPSQQKTVVQRQYRTHTPAQHAQFLQHAVSIDFTNPHPSASSDPAINTLLLDCSQPARSLLSRTHCHYDQQRPGLYHPTKESYAVAQELADASRTRGRSRRVVSSNWTQNLELQPDKANKVRRQNSCQADLDSSAAADWPTAGGGQCGRWRNGGDTE